MSIQSSNQKEPAARIALVTGGARRIGREICLELARAGWDIAIHCQRSVTQAETLAVQIGALGRRAIVLTADLLEAASASQLLAQVDRAYGGIDCVVNCASQFEFDDATALNVEALARLMKVNLATPILLAQELHRYCELRGREGRPAVVINLLDQKLFNMNPDFMSYTLTKAALQTATTMLAQALAPRVRVVGVAPGLTLPSSDQTEEEFEEAHRATPLGYSSTPLDIARAVCYLADSPAVTGTTLVVDGGQHLVPTQRDIMFVQRIGGEKC